jgi:hypothetical protein
MATAVALAPPGRAPAPAALAFLLFTGSSVHVASTAWFYCIPQVRAHMRTRARRYFWAPAALITGAGAAAWVLPRTAASWLLLPYFGWQFFHFQKQNLGVCALTASAWRIAPLRTAERRALLMAGAAGIAALLARPGLLQLPVRLPVPALFACAALGFGISILAGLRALARRSAADRPPAFAVVYLTAVAFMAPVFLFASPYAAVAGLVIAHGLQYLLLMGMLAAGDGSHWRRLARLAVLGDIAVAGGAVLSVASDQLAASGVQRALAGLFFGAVMAHFVVDAGLWRMRAQFPRAFLTERLPALLPAR